MTQTWVNGVASNTLTVQDRGLHYGDGVFETVALCQGRLRLWSAHWQRLLRGCAQLGIGLTDIEDELTSELEALAGAAVQGVVKIIITRGTGARGYASHDVGRTTRIVQLSPWPQTVTPLRQSGIRIRLCRQRLTQHAADDALAGIKHLNRLEQVVARREWRDDYHEGILCDIADHVIEGVMSNLFFVSQGELITPDLSYSGINGVMRAAVMQQAQALAIPCRVEAASIETLANADEIFFTNSIIGIWPARQWVMEHGIRDYEIGPVTKILQQNIKDSCCG